AQLARRGVHHRAHDPDRQFGPDTRPGRRPANLGRVVPLRQELIRSPSAQLLGNACLTFSEAGALFPRSLAATMIQRLHNVSGAARPPLSSHSPLLMLKTSAPSAGAL